MNPSQTLGGGVPFTTVTVSASDLITDALRELGVLRVGSRPSPEWLDDGKRMLNRLIDSWNAESIFVPSIVRDVYALTDGQQEYTLGVGGDLDGTRPTKILAAGYITSGSTDEEETDILTDNAWPLMTIRLQDEAASGDYLVIYRQDNLQTFGDLDTQYGFPPGYALALTLKLALLLAARSTIHCKIPRPRLNSIEKEAHEAVTRIKRANLIVPDLAMDPGLEPPRSTLQFTR